MTPQLELTVLARTLWREGYDDHLAGHITIKLADGTFLTNPWFNLWDEFTPLDVVRIDIDGTVVDGRWPPAPGVKLHLEVHKLRDDVNVAVHNHPRFATLWANARRIPPCLDQSSGLGGGRIALVEEYDGTWICIWRICGIATSPSPRAWLIPSARPCCSTLCALTKSIPNG